MEGAIIADGPSFPLPAFNLLRPQPTASIGTPRSGKLADLDGGAGCPSIRGEPRFLPSVRRVLVIGLHSQASGLGAISM